MNDSVLLLWAASIGLAGAIIILLMGWCAVFGKTPADNKSIMVVALSDNIRIVASSEQILQAIARGLADTSSKPDGKEARSDHD